MIKEKPCSLCNGSGRDQVGMPKHTWTPLCYRCQGKGVIVEHHCDHCNDWFYDEFILLGHELKVHKEK